MAKSVDKDARLIEQLARGRRTRYVESIGFKVALARTNNTAPNRIMADVITAETEIFPIFAAPCDCKVVKIIANGTPYADMATSGTVTLDVTKAVIGGGDVSLLASTIGIGAATVPTADTPLEGTLSATAGATNLIFGQNVFATVVVTGNVDTAVAYITATVEYVPTDSGYPRGG